MTQAELEKKRQELRLEAVIAGFTECYRGGRFKDILTEGKGLDKKLIENSTDIYDFIDIVEAKVEG